MRKLVRLSGVKRGDARSSRRDGFLKRAAAYIRSEVSLRNFGIALVTAFVLWEIFGQTEQTYYFDTVTVPKDLLERGVTPGYLTARIAQNIASMESAVESASLTDSILLSKEETQAPSIEIPSTHLTIREVTDELRHLAKREPSRINAEVVIIDVSKSQERRPTNPPEGKRLELTFQVSGSGQSGGVQPASSLEEDLDSLIRESGRAILKVINPYLLCAFLAGPGNDLKGAEQVAQELLKIGDARSSASAHRLLGNILSQKNDIPGAVGEYKNALQLNPNDAFTHNNLGIAYKKLGKLADAEVEFRSALRLNSKLALTHYNLGNTFTSESRFQDASREYAIATRKDPRLSDAWSSWGNLLEREGDYLGAQKKYEIAVRENPRNAIAYYNLGHIFSLLNDSADCERNYEQALRLRPKFPVALLGLGVMMENRGDIGGALENYKSAVIADPRLVQAYINAGNAHAKLGEVEPAYYCYRTALIEAPNTNDAVMGLKAVEPLMKSSSQLDSGDHRNDYQIALSGCVGP